jgi:hypothetical protein
MLPDPAREPLLEPLRDPPRLPLLPPDRAPDDRPPPERPRVPPPPLPLLLLLRARVPPLRLPPLLPPLLREPVPPPLPLDLLLLPPPLRPADDPLRFAAMTLAPSPCAATVMAGQGTSLAVPAILPHTRVSFPGAATNAPVHLGTPGVSAIPCDRFGVPGRRTVPAGASASRVEA